MTAQLSLLSGAAGDAQQRADALPSVFEQTWAEREAREGVWLPYVVVSAVEVGVLWTICIRCRGRQFAAIHRPAREAAVHLFDLAREHAYLDDRFADRMGDARA